MRTRLLPLLLCPLLLSVPLVPGAQADQSLWKVQTTDDKGFARLLAKGDEFAQAAVSARSQALRRARHSVGTSSQNRSAEALAQSLARKAIATYEEAAKAAPHNEEPNYRAGEVLLTFMLDSNVSPPSALDQAIEHWRQFEKKAPLDPRISEILDSRSISLTKRGGPKNLLAAVADYDRQLELIDQSSEDRRVSVARLLSNRAELLMMLGDLKESIAGYERALSIHVDTVYGYGLAVALDRDKQGMRARAVAKTYALADSENAINRNGTFFVPAGEVYYYHAMREEGRGDYRAAIKAYEEFVGRLPRSPWADQARRNIKDLAPKAAKQPVVKSKPRRVKGFSWGP